MRIGVLTGGGDCPGLNAVIRAVLLSLDSEHKHQVVGFIDAWDGVVSHHSLPLRYSAVHDVISRGGTLLGTKRGSPLDDPDGPAKVAEAVEELGLDGLIVIGGNGTLHVANELHKLVGLNVIGVPKTIDNDVPGTEISFGFNTAVQIATDAIDRLHTTSESHDRTILVEVMGRRAGWIAAHAGVSSGATAILVPEHPFDINDLATVLERHHRMGRVSSIVVVAEGATPAEGSFELPAAPLDRWGRPVLGGIAQTIAPHIESRTGFEVRVVTLGHVQRGGTPTAYDRVLATRYGLAAGQAAHAKQWGTVVVRREGNFQTVALSECVGEPRQLDASFYNDVVRAFQG